MMKNSSNTESTYPSPAARPRKQALAVAVVLALGLAGGWAILRGGPAVAGADAHAHGEGEPRAIVFSRVPFSTAEGGK